MHKPKFIESLDLLYSFTLSWPPHQGKKYFVLKWRFWMFTLTVYSFLNLEPSRSGTKLCLTHLVHASDWVNREFTLPYNILRTTYLVSKPD